MKNTLYIIFVLSILTWTFVYYILKSGSIVYILLMIAGIIVLLDMAFARVGLMSLRFQISYKQVKTNNNK